MTSSLLDPYPVPSQSADFARDRNRAILTSSQVSSPSLGFTGFSLLSQVNEFMARKEAIRTVIEGVASMERISEIRQQLAPEQSVVVIENRSENGSIQNVQILQASPGQSYIIDGEKAKATRVTGTSDICYPPGKSTETKVFRVDGRAVELQESSVSPENDKEKRRAWLD